MKREISTAEPGHQLRCQLLDFKPCANLVDGNHGRHCGGVADGLILQLVEDELAVTVWRFQHQPRMWCQRHSALQQRL